MNQSFNFKYNQLRENNLTTKNNAQSPNDENNTTTYYEQGGAKNICFVWPEGRKFFLNYAYLVSGEYQAEDNNITLIWTTHIVTLKGYQLEKLFDELMQHLPKYVVCVDMRYNQISENGKSVVNEIGVVTND